MKHLFIDDHEIQVIHNLARKLHQPQHFPNNVVLRPEHRWENAGIQLGTVPIWDSSDSKFKTIYVADGAPVDGGDRGRHTCSCYAESDDGINWRKPFVGLCDYPEPTWTGKPIGRDNNILPSLSGVLRGPVCDEDDVDERQRYKGFFHSAEGLHRVVSSDCLHWENMAVDPLQSHDVAQLTLQEDPRLFITMAKQSGPYGRSYCLTTSDDFVDWSEQELVFHADQIDQENGFARLGRFFDDPRYKTPTYNRVEEWRTDIYNFPVIRYEGLYLALPVMHHWSGKKPPLYENVESRKSVELACSRDLRHWERVANRTPFLELSPVGDGRSYDLAQLVTAEGFVSRNNELWFFLSGLKHRALSIADAKAGKLFDSSAVYMTKLRIDGFVGLKGGWEWGSVVTKPLEVAASNLSVNVDAWRGKLRVEVLDPEEDRALSGFSADDSLVVAGNHIDERVNWTKKQDLSGLLGRTVRLRFSLWQSELYSFWFC
jgi:hypothetical protein